MKKCFLTLSILLIGCCAALSTWVLIPANSMFGLGAYNKPMTITSVYPVLTDGTNFYIGTTTNVPASTSNVMVWLSPNYYQLTFSTAVTPVRFSVTNSPNVLNLMDLISSGPVTVYPFPAQYVLPIASASRLGGFKSDEITLHVDPTTGIATVIGGGSQNTNALTPQQAAVLALAITNLAGDVTSSPGGGTVTTTLKTTGTAGTYTKPTFDAQGRETSGTNLSLSDLPPGYNNGGAAATATTAGDSTNAFRFYPGIDFTAPSSVQIIATPFNQLQGVAIDKRNYDRYIIYNSGIQKYNAAGVMITSNYNLFPIETPPAQTVYEDGDFYNGQLVIPRMIYTDINQTNTHNLELDFFDTNLVLTAQVGISNIVNQCASLVDNPDTHQLALLQEYDGSQIYLLNDTNFTSMGTLKYKEPQFPLIHYQGIAYKSGMYYEQANIAWGAVMYLVDSVTGENHFVWDTEASVQLLDTGNEAEGLDFNGTNLLLAIADSEKGKCIYTYNLPPPILADKFGQVKISSLRAQQLKVEQRMSTELGYPDPLADNMILDVPFSEIPQSSTIFDRSKNQYSLSIGLVGNQLQMPMTNGPAGNAVFLNGTSYCMQNTNTFNGMTNFSMSVWLLPNGVQNSFPVSKHNNGPDGSFFLRLINATNVDFSTVSTNSTRVDLIGITPTVVNDGLWHHIGASYDARITNGANMFLYWDGVLIGSGTNSGALKGTTTAFIIGGCGSGFPYLGGLDEVKMWNRVLTPAEFNYIFNQYGLNKNFLGNVQAGGFAGSGAGLTNLNAASISGKLPDANLSTNVATVAFVNTNLISLSQIKTNGAAPNQVISWTGSGAPTWVNQSGSPTNGLAGTNIFNWSTGGATNFALAFNQAQNPSYTISTNVINFTNVTGTSGSISFLLSNTTVFYDPNTNNFSWLTPHPTKVTNGIVSFSQYGTKTVGAYSEFQ